MRAEFDLPFHRLDDGGMRMAEQHGAVAAEVIDILVAVDVPLARARGARNVDRIGVEVARVVGDAARQHLMGALEQSRRFARPGLVVGDHGRVRLR